MKFKKIMIIAIIMLISFASVGKMSFAQLKVIGSYSKSEREVLFNPGRGSVYLSAYEVKGKDGPFICIDDLQALNFTKKWNAKKRQTSFDLKVHEYHSDEILDFEVDGKILQKNKDYLQKNKNLYKTDVKIFVNGRQVESYNTDGYSLVSVKSLKNIGLDNFFIWDNRLNISGKLYPMVSDFGVGLVDIHGNLIVKPNYDSIEFFGGNNDRYLVKKDGRFMIIDSKNQLIADLSSYNFSPRSYAYSTERGLVIISDPENNRMELFNSSGDSVMSEDEYKDFYFVGDKYVVGQKIDGSRHIFLIENEKLTLFTVLQKPEKDYYRISGIFADMIFEGTDYGCPINIYDSKGKKIQNPGYSYIYPFNGNYAVAWLPSKRFTLVDKELNRVTDMDFKDVSKVENNLFIFLKDIDYDGGRSSTTGLDGALFGIGSLGDGIIVPAEYKKLKIYNNLIRFSKEGELYGVMDKYENIILKEEFDSIQVIEDKIYALKGENLFTYSLDGILKNQEKFSGKVELRDSIKNYGQFVSDTIHYDYPKDLPKSVWDDYRDGLFTQGDIDFFEENNYSNPETHYGFSTVKYMVTKKGIRIPYCITTRGMVAPPPDNFFPTYLEK
ncbi:WG repeat-containing protein [Tepidibacter hydrothermalis]|uniref:WG repeat-containing protein n=1 Tax=Tepidibacter hydrothermalis TaxID=3036126 RepID=A0ABY8EKQ0_9FIRM|nr:WG repeat-containing protein [Tepidibacter hydrothermalis]WFD11835.1 WG repeat-containing protein [Tepidibacter hydrothermalis]